MEALAHLLAGRFLGLHTSAPCAENGEDCASPSKAKELARRRRRAPGLRPGSGGSAALEHPALRSPHRRAARLSTRPGGRGDTLTSRARAAAVASGDRPRGSDRRAPAPPGLRPPPRVSWCPRSQRLSGGASDTAAPLTARARALTYQCARRQV